jgi:predicted transcriptional regulator
MPRTETMTIRVSSELKAQLDRIAEATQRSRSFLAGEAISRFVMSEAKIVEGIKAGMADISEGRVMTHEAAMKKLRATINNPREPGQ